MAFPDPILEGPLERSGAHPDNRQDIIPEHERSEDPFRNELEQGMARNSARPLTDDEKKAADRDAPAGERVYAPASERVPIEPAPGDRQFVEHPDTHTAERQAAGQTPGSTQSTEPSFTRVPRPSTGEAPTPTPGRAYASPMSNPGFRNGTDDEPSGQSDGRRKLFMGIGFSWFALIGAGVGVWLLVRWRSERNKPLNRLRRQALQAAYGIRERVPNPEDAARPAMGFTTALLSIALLLWKQAQARSSVNESSEGGSLDKVGRQTERLSRRAEKAWGKAEQAYGRASGSVSETDWQKRLSQLKERWSPGRVELEKVTISKKR